MIPVIDKYSSATGTYYFPSDDIPVSEKNAEWGRAFCEAIYASYMRNRTGLFYNQRSQFELLRAYGMGRQNPNKYKDVLYGKSKNQDPLMAQSSGEFERKGYMNINWDILPIIPKFKNAVIGKYLSVNHRITCNAVDETSINTKQDQKWKLWFEKMFNEQIQKVQMKAMAEQQKVMAAQGIQGQPQPPLPEINELPPMQAGMELPQDINELELYDKMGGFKLKLEEAMEVLIDECMTNSKFIDIKQKLLADIFDLGVCAVKDYVDATTGKVKARYVDPINLVAQYSRDFGFDNSEFVGEFVNLTLADVRKATKLSEAEITQLAQVYNTFLNNPTLNGSSYYSYVNPDNNYLFDNYRICVMDCEWVSLNTEYKVERTTKYGDTRVYEGKFGKIVDTDKRKTQKVQYKTIYKCKWIVGTKIVFDFGLQHDIPRKDNEVKLSYHIYKIPGRSMTETIIPMADQIQLAFLRLQNEIAKSPGSGLLLEYDSLANLSEGGSNLSPFELIKIHQQTGSLVYKASMLSSGQTTNTVPIRELEGGIGRYLLELFQIMDKNTQLIRDATGINEITDATTPATTLAVGTSKMALASTNNILARFYLAYLLTVEAMAQNIALRAQIVMRHNPEAYQKYLTSIGYMRSEIIKMSADIPFAEYVIKAEELPSDEQKSVIRNAAMESMRAGKNNMPGITMSDYLFIERMLENGNLKYAQAFLSYREQKENEKREMLQQQNMELNGKNAIAIEQKKLENELAIIQAKADAQIRIEEAKARFAHQQSYVDTQNKIAEQAVMNDKGEQPQQSPLGALAGQVQGQEEMMPQEDVAPQEQPMM